MTYRMPLYLPLGLFAAAIVLVVLGFYWKRRNDRLKKFGSLAHLGCYAIAALAGLIFAPQLLRDRVVLDEHRLEQPVGFWFIPGKTTKGFDLDDVQSIVIHNEERAGRRGRVEIHEIWTASYLGKSDESVDVGDLWEYNGADIADRLRQRGITVRDER